MTGIRRFRPGDEPALADVCLRTADAGADARGVLTADDLWAELFVLPYVARHPETAFVAVAGDRVAGYVVCAPDTAAFERWFRASWWPAQGARFPRPGGNARERALLAYADARGLVVDERAAAYPAHLHIDLLPELQGQGMGRRLVDTLLARLRADGVPGLHLVADGANAGALAFYRRLGFAELPSAAGEQAFGIRL